LIGAVWHVDRFGNLITNIPAERFLTRGVKRILFCGQTLPFLRTYAEASEGQALALVGSDGLLEIAVFRGSALERFGRTGEVIVELL